MLIHGDNLLALKALEQKYAGQIKCIYIDPPYNTGAAFEHYDDNLEHSTWLSLMRVRIKILYSLLHRNGSLWISIDDDECHYLKEMCDEVFGRENFVTSISWQKKGSRSNDAKWFSDNHDYILVYAKNKEMWKLNKLNRETGVPKGYPNPDNDPRGVWTSTIMSAKSGSDSLLYKITTPSGNIVSPPTGRYWSCSKTTFERWCNENRIWFDPDGDRAPRKKTFLSEVQEGLVPLTVWLRDEVGDNQEAKHEIKSLNLSTNPFDTPKPERLLQRILTIATNPGDLVLDSFLGSRTTSGRKWNGNMIAKMLHNPRYMGIEKFGGEIFTDVIPQIVEEKLWQVVNGMMLTFRRNYKKDKYDPYFLTGKIFCGYCGESVFAEAGSSHMGTRYKYYKCHTKKVKGKSCELRNYRKQELEQMIIDKTKQYILTPTKIEEFVHMVVDRFSEELSNNTVLKCLEKELRQINSKINGLVKNMEQGIVSVAIRETLYKLENDRADIQLKIAEEKPRLIDR